MPRCEDDKSGSSGIIRREERVGDADGGKNCPGIVHAHNMRPAQNGRDHMTRHSSQRSRIHIQISAPNLHPIRTQIDRLERSLPGGFDGRHGWIRP